MHLATKNTTFKEQIFEYSSRHTENTFYIKVTD